MAMGSKRKAYVRVISETDEQGRVTPLAIVWRGGERYRISRARSDGRRYANDVLSVAERYAVRIEGRDTYLYYEAPKWFVVERC